MTRYAIGDIHGGSKTLQALLGRLNLRPGDRLHLLGDYIDRGPDSRGVLDTIMRLMAVGYDVRPVRGNHEDMLLQSLSGSDDYWMEGWGKETLKSFGATSLDELPDVYYTFLDQMPYIRADENFVFVHAGLDMTVDDPLTESTPNAMVWRENSPFGRDRLEGRTLVTGHKIRPLPLIEASLLTNNFQLDNGAFTAMQPNFGNLVALNLDTMELFLQRWCD
ncbi:MAG: metallophosphoesterase family protein [Desulfuromonadaceae bacterium]|nr:metallophosphoesterase family protein [Desulfuromonadaceae bacterium]